MLGSTKISYWVLNWIMCFVFEALNRMDVFQELNWNSHNDSLRFQYF